MPCAVVLAFALLSTGCLCELIHNFVFISVFCFDFGGFFLFIRLNRVWWLAKLDWIFFIFFWVTKELSTLRQRMEVPNEPGLCPNTGLENTS